MNVVKIKEKYSPDDISCLSKDDQIVWLMEEYGDMVIRLAYTYVKQKQLAEDISQEVFISCYNNLDRFEQKSSYKTWIYRITANKCKDYLRSWSFKNIYYKDVIGSFLKSGTPAADQKLVAKEEKEEIFNQVLSLPLKLREVIILFYYEDCSIEEIAALLHLNANTVKTRLHRGRNSLKTSFQGRDIF